METSIEEDVTAFHPLPNVGKNYEDKDIGVLVMSTFICFSGL